MLKFKNYYFILLAFLVITNGICNYFLGEIISEGLAIASTCIFFITRLKEFKLLRKLMFPILVLVIYIVYNFFIIIYLEQYERALFLYTYLLFLALVLVPSYSNKITVDNISLINVLFLFACISSAYAIIQRFGVETFFPLEGAVRATGLSRSSLNLTGCLLAVFGTAIFCIRDSIYKLFGLSIIFLGILAAGGRGGIISSMIILAIVYYKKLLNLKYLFIFFLLVCLNLIFFYEWIIRGFSAFNFVSDQSNIDRTVSYLNFINEFQFLGSGVGTTSPSVSRFLKSTGFESSLLNMVYEFGIPFTMLFSVALIDWYKALYYDSKKVVFIFFLSLSPVIIGQQLFGSPSAFCTLILSLYILISFRGH